MIQMSTDQKAANAVSGKTARACDSCLRRRARWYCTADDAFLCQACDASVHSANPLARRHDRVRLKTASSSSLPPPTDLINSATPSWPRGCKRKARTPRHGKSSVKPPVSLVPDLDEREQADQVEEEEVEQEELLLYQVPVFDRELICSAAPVAFEETKAPAMSINGGFAGLEQLDVELAEFAADVESLLGQGFDGDSLCNIDGLGLLEAREEYDHEDADRSQVKMEMEMADTAGGVVIDHESKMQLGVDMEMELSGESLDFNFDCGSAEEDVEEKKVETNGGGISLRLDYAAVIAEWSCRGSCSPWTEGKRPQLSLDDCWPHLMGLWGCGDQEAQAGVVYGEMVGVGGHVGNSDGGREARVSRYREKRRTRLFSKKIRYEVRKLNAEKRPRMKGRFVKRPSTMLPAAAAAAGGVAGAFSYV